MRAWCTSLIILFLFLFLFFEHQLGRHRRDSADELNRLLPALCWRHALGVGSGNSVFQCNFFHPHSGSQGSHSYSNSNSTANRVPFTSARLSSWTCVCECTSTTQWYDGWMDGCCFSLALPLSKISYSVQMCSNLLTVFHIKIARHLSVRRLSMTFITKSNACTA